MKYEYTALSDENVFNIVHDGFTAYWERDFGDVTDSAIDRGGITKNGVTLKLLKELEKEGYKVDLNKDGTVDKKDLILVSPKVAKEIFKFEFWERGKSYCCPPLTAMVYYDFAVNSGAGNAARRLQMAIDVIAPKTIVSYAANMGPKTRSALMKFTKQDHSLGLDSQLALEFCKQREAYVREIVKNDSKQKGNLAGWINRINALVRLVKDESYNFCCNKNC